MSKSRTKRLANTNISQVDRPEIDAVQVTEPESQPAATNERATSTPARKTSAFCIGMVVRRFGTEGGITLEMLAEYTRLSGWPSSGTTEDNLVWEMESIRGYCVGNVS